jgi:hypothetical protein
MQRKTTKVRAGATVQEDENRRRPSRHLRAEGLLISLNGFEEDLLADDDALEALADLERKMSDAVKQMRTSSRIRVKSMVIAQPGNSSDRVKSKIRVLRANFRPAVVRFCSQSLCGLVTWSG